MSIKSDTLNPVMRVNGNGEVTISGSLRAKSLHMTTHKMNPGDNQARYVRFDTNGGDLSPGDNNKLVAPYAGKLIKIMGRCTSAPGSTVVSLHTNVDGNQNVNTTATENRTVNMAVANTTYAFEFTDSAQYGPNDIVGIKFSGSNDPGSVTLTAVWEFDQNT
jgi:hypothetical protein